MAGNFHRVLIFVIFVVDLAVTKFFHPRKLMLMVIWLCESMMMGMATNIIAAWPTVVIVIQLIASSTLIFFYVMLFVQVSIGKAIDYIHVLWYGLVANKEDRK